MAFLQILKIIKKKKKPWRKPSRTRAKLAIY